MVFLARFSVIRRTADLMLALLREVFRATGPSALGGFIIGSVDFALGGFIIGSVDFALGGLGGFIIGSVDFTLGALGGFILGITGTGRFATSISYIMWRKLFTKPLISAMSIQ